jgi:hypothetical protein
MAFSSRRALARGCCGVVVEEEALLSGVASLYFLLLSKMVMGAASA